MYTFVQVFHRMKLYFDLSIYKKLDCNLIFSLYGSIFCYVLTAYCCRIITWMLAYFKIYVFKSRETNILIYKYIYIHIYIQKVNIDK